MDDTQNIWNDPTGTDQEDMSEDQGQTPSVDEMLDDLTPQEEQEAIDFITQLWSSHPEAMNKLR
jgi:hypothetical protein